MNEQGEQREALQMIAQALTRSALALDQLNEEQIRGLHTGSPQVLLRNVSQALNVAAVKLGQIQAEQSAQLAELGSTIDALAAKLRSKGIIT